MALNQLKSFLTLKLTLIWIAFTAQTPNDSITCLEDKKINFLLEWHLRAKNLMADTTEMGKELRYSDEIIGYKDNQISAMGKELDLKDTIISKNRNSILRLYKDSQKKDKKIRLFKNATVISSTLVVILACLIIILKISV